MEESKAVGERLRKMKSGYTLAYAQQDFCLIEAPAFVDKHLRNMTVAYP